MMIVKTKVSQVYTFLSFHMYIFHVISHLHSRTKQHVNRFVCACQVVVRYVEAQGQP